MTSHVIEIRAGVKNKRDKVDCHCEERSDDAIFKSYPEINTNVAYL